MDSLVFRDYSMLFSESTCVCCPKKKKKHPGIFFRAGSLEKTHPPDTSRCRFLRHLPGLENWIPMGRTVYVPGKNPTGHLYFLEGKVNPPRPKARTLNQNKGQVIWVLGANLPDKNPTKCRYTQGKPMDG